MKIVKKTNNWFKEIEEIFTFDSQDFHLLGNWKWKQYNYEEDEWYNKEYTPEELFNIIQWETQEDFVLIKE